MQIVLFLRQKSSAAQLISDTLSMTFKTLIRQISLSLNEFYRNFVQKKSQYTIFQATSEWCLKFFFSFSKTTSSEYSRGALLNRRGSKIRDILMGTKEMSLRLLELVNSLRGVVLEMMMRYYYLKNKKQTHEYAAATQVSKWIFTPFVQALRNHSL